MKKHELMQVISHDGPVTVGDIRRVTANPEVPDDAYLKVFQAEKDNHYRRVVAQWLTLED